MAGPGRGKRVREREEKPRNVKSKGELPVLETVVITQMEPFHLSVCWSVKHQKDFKLADLYGFLKWSINMPPVDGLLVEEFVRNYDPEDGSSVVKGRIVGIQAEILHQALYLPICEMSVMMDASEDFHAETQFKTGVAGFQKGQGWKVQEALTPELEEWMHFVQKRLALNRHSTYMAKNLLYAAVASLEGMKFNWAEYVASRMHNELSVKRVLGKVSALLCSNYVSEAIKYQLKQPICKELERPVATEKQVTPVPEVVIEDPNQSKGKKKVPEPIPKGVPSKNKGPQFEGQTSSERIVKEVILAQLSQLQLTVEKLVDAETIGSELEVMKKAAMDKQRGIDILCKQIDGWEEKCKNLEGDITRMDKAWRTDRLQAQANETVTKKEKAVLQKELADLLEKRSYQESEAQKLVRGFWSSMTKLKLFPLLRHILPPNVMKTLSFIFSREDCRDFKNYPACYKTCDALFRKPASRVVCVENQILFVDVCPVSMRHNADAICYLPFPFHGELHYPNDSRVIPNVAIDIIPFIFPLHRFASVADYMVHVVRPGRGIL